jgi:hypothetical protein
MMLRRQDKQQTKIDLLRVKLSKLLLLRLPLKRKNAKDPTTNLHGTLSGEPTSTNGSQVVPQLEPPQPQDILEVDTDKTVNGDQDGTIDGSLHGLEETGDGTNTSGQLMTRPARPVECAREAVLLNIRLRRLSKSTMILRRSENLFTSPLRLKQRLLRNSRLKLNKRQPLL